MTLCGARAATLVIDGNCDCERCLEAAATLEPKPKQSVSRKGDGA